MEYLFCLLIALSVYLGVVVIIMAAQMLIQQQGGVTMHAIVFSLVVGVTVYVGLQLS
jgi:phosphohistidine swiveling domain-containing protein